MDDVPEGEDDVDRTDLPVVGGDAVTGPATERVRIVGAEPAGEITGELPVVRDEVVGDDEVDEAQAVLEREDTLFDQPSVHLTDEPGEAGASGVDPVRPGETAVPSGTATPTELPHWTEPPTGQVPAVLSRDSGEDSPGQGIVAPTWREEDADWVAHDEEFEPAMFADDEVALGSLDETDDSEADRRPWEFDLDSVVAPADRCGPEGRRPTGHPALGRRSHHRTHRGGGPGVGTHHRTRTLRGLATTDPRASGGPRADHGGPGRGRLRRHGRRWRGVGAARTGRTGRPTVPTTDDDEKPSPTGSARLGRTRRAGLLPARMRAKRPEDVDPSVEAPLAAEPPGASVTDVPGAGRKRVGVAGLAAADRTAERAGDAAADQAPAAGAGGGRGGRGRRRRSPAPFPATAGTVPPGTGPGRRTKPALRPAGGPPARRRPRPQSVDPDRAGGSSIGVRVGTGIAVAVVALLAFKLGTVPSLVLCLIVVTFAAGECFAVLRGAGYHPATPARAGRHHLPDGRRLRQGGRRPPAGARADHRLHADLVPVRRRAGLAGGRDGHHPARPWAGSSLLGSYAGLLLSPSAFPDRHGIAFLLGAIIATVADDVGALVIGGWLGSRPLAPSDQPQQDLGGPGRRRRLSPSCSRRW